MQLVFVLKEIFFLLVIFRRESNQEQAIFCSVISTKAQQLQTLLEGATIHSRCQLQRDMARPIFRRQIDAN